MASLGPAAAAAAAATQAAKPSSLSDLILLAADTLDNKDWKRKALHTFDDVDDDRGSARARLHGKVPAPTNLSSVGG